MEINLLTWRVCRKNSKLNWLIFLIKKQQEQDVKVTMEEENQEESKQQEKQPAENTDKQSGSQLGGILGSLIGGAVGGYPGKNL